ncbi:MAG TPA: CDP-alcohol phosphatidyltransferase family protein [Flavobacteriaceae bacterium]|nr:CDP-alcohol phosphatidyltransferase family protein [Flavobacteriaceae bacterium]HPF12420.1 CDP-alcohol phosphatidyltransferase family protein [Flavobacteriaceae bacterium]HQU21604.1 CDP-alcohol phosphatidyltransferase family protein [Flavobacteriaceae bacterium]HQU66145.1 CDP-alcohol phosphatidyltransferase family protein [Flavobacteriaceae bacterium]HRW45745.1 CDP-alcohol phosphatidyltransferase family protein [Flavobacteriaceae bacterium]
MVKHIPNMITSLNLLCGAVAIVFALSGDLVVAAVFVFLGIFLDFFDGLAARLLKVQSALGAELDSLADMVTCGVVPGLVMFQLLNKVTSAGKSYSFGYEKTETMLWMGGKINFVPFIGFLIILGAAYRLAKFNVDTRQTHHFIGLPTPANALLVLSFPLIFEFQYTPLIEQVLFNQWFLIGITVLSVVLMNAEIPLFAFKFKTWDFKSNVQRWVFVVICIGLLLWLKFLALPLLIALYVVMSLLWRTSD